VRFVSQTALGVAALICIFFAHSCVSGPPLKPSHDITNLTMPTTVCVGLTWIKEPQEITVDGPLQIKRPGTEETAVLGRSSDSAAYTLGREGSGAIMVGRSSYVTPTLKLVPRCGWFRIRGLTAEGKTRVARYRGSLALNLTPKGWVAVNEIEVEDYMLGVVGKEMSLAKTPYEALKAQVVAARTYALYEQANGRVRQSGELFDLYDDDRSQMYGGMDAENDTAQQLVEDTRGLVVLYQGQLVHTVYSSTCGGSTEPAWEVLSTVQKIPPLAGVPCEFCRPSPHWEWRTTIKKSDLCEKLTGKKGMVSEVQVAKAAKGGHALLIRYQVAGEAKPRVVDASFGFRLKVGAKQIRSNLLVEIKDAGDAIEFAGRGWGHAAGMCQWGAWEMARAGRSAFDILLYYYPQATVEKIH
jgi:stage II sporulation protein D